MIQILICFTVLGFFITNSAMADTSKPNVVYIMADDLGWGDISVRGGGVATPKIDALFKQGIELTQFMGWCVERLGLRHSSLRQMASLRRRAR